MWKEACREPQQWMKALKPLQNVREQSSFDRGRTSKESWIFAGCMLLCEIRKSKMA